MQDLPSSNTISNIKYTITSSPSVQFGIITSPSVQLIKVPEVIGDVTVYQPMIEPKTNPPDLVKDIVEYKTSEDSSSESESEEFNHTNMDLDNNEESPDHEETSGDSPPRSLTPEGYP